MGNNRIIVFGILVLASLAAAFAVYSIRPEPPPLEISVPEPDVTPLNATIAAVEPTSEPPTPTPVPTPTPSPLRVYISGEINAPDVYTFPQGSILKDAIVAAGGATKDADLDVVNQALELKDQQHIHIPAKTELSPTPPVVDGGVVEPTTNPQLQTRSVVLEVDTSGGKIINLNAAGAAEFETLPGIGPAIAQRIIEYRETTGNFAAIEDLTNVKGIGPATFEKLKDFVTVN